MWCTPHLEFGSLVVCGRMLQQAIEKTHWGIIAIIEWVRTVFAEYLHSTDVLCIAYPTLGWGLGKKCLPIDSGIMGAYADL